MQTGEERNGEAREAAEAHEQFLQATFTREERERIHREIGSLIASLGGEAREFDAQLIAQIMETALKMLRESHDTGQLKLMTTAFKEMRYAYRVFNEYAGVRKVTIFGSARTPLAHPDFVAARDFSQIIATHGWMAITGAGGGIMHAGHIGPKREASFGLSIRLPFETTANEVITGDPKLINFRYFFTRKLMFVSHADAVAVFPGGFGTQDELFEALTLVQTGRSNIMPIVLLEGEGGVYWKHWETYIQKNLFDTGMISPEDPSIYFIAESEQEAVDHILRFYRVYHSSRYVGPKFVIRIRRPLTEAELAGLNDRFSVLVREGAIEQGPALEGETDHLQLPRIFFDHRRHKYGMLRQLIDRLNDFGGDEADTPLDVAASRTE